MSLIYLMFQLMLTCALETCGPVNPVLHSAVLDIHLSWRLRP